ncbi:MAG: hypothetical protein ACI3W5_02735 [Faecousia sp.]
MFRDDFGDRYDDEDDTEAVLYDRMDVDDEDSDEEDENALWVDEDSEETEEEASFEKQKKKRRNITFVDAVELDDSEDPQSEEQTRQQVALEQTLIDRTEADAEEHPLEDDAGDEEPARKKLKRELRAEALARLEDAARTQRDYENVIAWWDKLDANRERRERYHELSRSGDDLPLDYGASANELYFPNTLNDVVEKQIRRGDFIDALFDCPYDIHELVTEEYLSQILMELRKDHKELLFLCGVRQFSTTRIAAIRQQSDRNIRKVRGTMLKQIRKKLLAALKQRADRQQPLTMLERDFLEDGGTLIAGRRTV